MDLPLDELKKFIGGLVIENLAFQHRVAALEAERARVKEQSASHAPVALRPEAEGVKGA